MYEDVSGGSTEVCTTAAAALATRMGPLHVATHQVALSLFWLITYCLDSGSISGQVLMSKNMGNAIPHCSSTYYSNCFHEIKLISPFSSPYCHPLSMVQPLLKVSSLRLVYALRAFSSLQASSLPWWCCLFLHLFYHRLHHL